MAIPRVGGRTYAPTDLTSDEAKQALDAAGITLDASGTPTWTPGTGAHRTDPVATARGVVAPSGLVYNPVKDTYEQPHMDIGERIAIMAALAVATYGTAGALAPYTGPAMAGVIAGAGTGAVSGGIQGGAKGALIGAGLGAAGGYASSGAFSGAGSAATKTGTDIAKDAAIKAGIGAAQGAANGGGVEGALIGAGTGAAGAGVSGATQGAPLAARIAAQAGTKAAIGAATGGTSGAIQGAAAGVGAGMKGGSMATPGTADDGSGIDWTQLLTSTAIPVGASIASSLAQGREAGRTQQANQTVTQDTQRQTADANYERAIEQRVLLALQQAQDQRAAQNDAYHNAIRSSVAKNIGDVSFSRPGGVPNLSVTGGLRPSALGGEGKAAADALYKQSMSALLNPAQPAALPALEKSSVSALPQPSSVDTALGIAGAIGKGLTTAQQQQAQNAQSSLVQELLKRSRQQANTPAPQLVAPNAQPASPFDYFQTVPNPSLPADDSYLYDI